MGGVRGLESRACDWAAERTGLFVWFVRRNDLYVPRPGLILTRDTKNPLAPSLAVP